MPLVFHMSRIGLLVRYLKKTKKNGLLLPKFLIKKEM